MKVNMHDIRITVEKAILYADMEKNSHDFCVNWGDLHCVNVEWYQDIDGYEGYRVWIEEADPDNWKFRKFIADYVKDKLGVDIEVKTEW